MSYGLKSILNYCDEMDIAEEAILSKYFEKRKERKNKEREEAEQRRKERIEINKKLEAQCKPILMKIAKDFIQTFNRNVIRYTHCNGRFDGGINYYSDLEMDYIEIDIEFLEQSDRSSDNAWDDFYDCLKKSQNEIIKKYKKEFDMYDIRFDGDGDIIYLVLKLKESVNANESFIELVMESAKDMKNAWDQTYNKMTLLKDKIESEDEVSEVKKMLSEYLDLASKLKSDIESMDYSFIDKSKYKVHKILSSAVPLLSFIGTFAGITILNKKATEFGLDKVGGITKFFISSAVGVGSAIQIGSPKDIKKYYLKETSYLMNEIKLQQKLIDALLTNGICNMSDVDKYDVDITPTKIKITKK